MTQQKIEKAISAIDNEMQYLQTDGNEKYYQILLDIAKLYLSVMKLGILQKLEPILIDIGVGNLESEYEKGYNQAIDEFTAYLAQKLSGLEEVIRESSLCHLCLAEVWEAEKEIKELVSSIRKHLGVEK